MADIVQEIMEEMIPELDVLLKNSIFSEEEINVIVKQRRSFEYAQRSSNVSLEDHLRYINYESNIEKLRQIRMKKMNFSEKKIKLINKTTGVKRLHHLYRKMLKYHANNVDLWFQYIKFCTACRSFKALSFAFAQSIRVHPLNPELWIKAAYWEYEQNHNITAARVLMQKALRILKKEKTLWLHYSRLELLYRKKLTDRLEIMGVEQTALVANEEDQIDVENNEDKDVPEDKELAIMNEETKEISTGEETSNPFFEGKIASIIFRGACNVFPDDLEFHLEFWHIYRSFQNTELLQEEVYEYIRTQSSLHSKARGFLSRIPLLSCSVVENSSDFFDSYQQCKMLFRANLKELNTSEMFSEFVSFFQQLLSRSLDDQCSLRLIKDLLPIFKEAYQNDVATPALMRQWVDTLKMVGDIKSACGVAENAIADFPAEMSVVQLFCEVHLFLLIKKFPSPVSQKEESETLVKISELLASSLTKLHENFSLFSIWILLKNYFVLSNAEVNVVKKFIKVFIQRLPCLGRLSHILQKLLVFNPKDIHAIKSDALRFFIIQFGIVETRKLFKSSCEFPPTKVEHFKEMIQIESAQMNPSNKVICSLYERAILEKQAKDFPDIFLQYIQHEMTNQNFEKIQTIHWKAKKTLLDTDTFERRYESLTK